MVPQSVTLQTRKITSLSHAAKITMIVGNDNTISAATVTHQLVKKLLEWEVVYVSTLKKIKRYIPLAFQASRPLQPDTSLHCFTKDFTLFHTRFMCAKEIWSYIIHLIYGPLFTTYRSRNHYGFQHDQRRRMWG